jgi:hypothetical protein
MSASPAPENGGETTSRAAQIDAFLAELSPLEQQIFGAERHALAELLKTQPRAEAVLNATRQAFSHGAQIGARHLQILQPAQSIACREGCHWCCHLKVSVTAPEALALASFVAHRMLPAERQRITARVAELAADPRIFSEYAKAEAMIPCALLTEAGACAAYDARPLACRGWNSTDADACRRSLVDDSLPTPMNPSLARECAAVGLGLRAAMTDAGLSGEILELTSALDIALRTPQALERWLDGEAIFAPASAGP